MSLGDLSIEKTVELDRNYPRVSERYFSEYYFIPGEKNVEGNGENNVERNDKNVEGNDKNVEGNDKNVEGNDKNIEGNAKNVEGNDKNVEGNDKNIEGNAKNVGENDKKVEGKGDVSEKLTEEDKLLEGRAEETLNAVTGENNTFQSDNHTCVLIHSNKLCLLTLSHHHPVLSKGKDIVKVDYDVGKFNRLQNQVSGKGKRGAQMIGPKSPLCKVICADGSLYTILAGVNGKLIEVNEELCTNPKLLSESPKEEGYLAIVLPPLRNGNSLVNRLLTKEKYEALIKEKQRESVS